MTRLSSAAARPEAGRPEPGRPEPGRPEAASAAGRPETAPAEAMPRGVLRPSAATSRFTLATREPPAELAGLVEYYWIVRWDLRGEPDYTQAVLPHPNVHLAFEAPAAEIHGVSRSLFSRRLSGAGKVLGVRFRAGGFRPFFGAPVRQLTDRIVPAGMVFGAASERTRALIMDPDAGDEEMATHASRLLLAVSPRPDPMAGRAAALVELIVADPSLRRVRDLALVSGMSIRGLERLFREYVGVTPKWVMRRARLHEAAMRADSGEPADWGQLAADLGYADQAHLTRDFTRTIGVPPSEYASR